MKQLTKQDEMIILLKKVQKSLYEMRLIKGINNWKITQIAKKTGTTVTEVFGLKIDIDYDGQEYWICCYDIFDKIMKEGLIPMLFIPQSLMGIDVTNGIIRLDFIGGDFVTFEPMAS
jgi:hypothetical protein